MTSDTEAERVAASMERSERVIMIHHLFNPKGWEPKDPMSPIVCSLVEKGLFVRRDGRCGFERFKDSYIVPTKLGLRVRTILKERS